MDDNPSMRLAWNSLVLINKANKMLGCDMGKNDFTEKDARVFRVATVLSFELCNESLSYCVKRLAKQLSINEVKYVFDNVVYIFGQVISNVFSVPMNLRNTPNDKQKYMFKVRIIKETIDFLEQVRDLIETNVTYTIGKENFVIYQNRDFREKTKALLEQLTENWEALTSGFTREGNITRLDSVRREVERLINRPLSMTVDGHNKLQNITPDDKKIPRKIGD